MFAEPTAATRAAGLKGGEWVFATHDLADGGALLAAVVGRMQSGALHAWPCCTTPTGFCSRQAQAAGLCPMQLFRHCIIVLCHASRSMWH